MFSKITYRAFGALRHLELRSARFPRVFDSHLVSGREDDSSDEIPPFAFNTCSVSVMTPRLARTAETCFVHTHTHTHTHFQCAPLALSLCQGWVWNLPGRRARCCCLEEKERGESVTKLLTYFDGVRRAVRRDDGASFFSG